MCFGVFFYSILYKKIVVFIIIEVIIISVHLLQRVKNVSFDTFW